MESKQIISIKHCIIDNLPKLNKNICKIITKFLVFKTGNKNKICEWDLYDKVSSGYSNKGLVKPKRLYYYLHSSGWEDCATDCSESDEFSVNEIDDEKYSVRIRSDFKCNMDSRGDRKYNSISNISKLELFNMLNSNDIYIFQFNSTKLYREIFNNPSKYDFVNCESGDEADDECE